MILINLRKLSTPYTTIRVMIVPYTLIKIGIEIHTILLFRPVLLLDFMHVPPYMIISSCMTIWNIKVGLASVYPGYSILPLAACSIWASHHPWGVHGLCNLYWLLHLCECGWWLFCRDVQCSEMVVFLSMCAFSKVHGSHSEITFDTLNWVGWAK